MNGDDNHPFYLDTGPLFLVFSGLMKAQDEAMREDAREPVQAVIVTPLALAQSSIKGRGWLAEAYRHGVAVTRRAGLPSSSSVTVSQGARP